MLQAISFQPNDLGRSLKFIDPEGERDEGDLDQKVEPGGNHVHIRWKGKGDSRMGGVEEM